MNRQDRRTRSRVHIAVGFALTSLYLLFGALTIKGADLPKKLVIANTSSYTTSIIATAKPESTETVTVNIADVILYGAGVTLTVPARGAAYARRVEKTFESKKPFYLLDAPLTVDTSTVLSFSNGASRSSFTLPVIAPITPDHSATVGPLISDDVEGAWVTVFPKQANTPIWLIVHDAQNLTSTKWEVFSASPPVTQYRITTPGISMVEVRIGDPWFGCLPFFDCYVFNPVYGFASTGTPDGGNFRAFQFN